MSDFRARAENVQNELGTFYCGRDEISKRGWVWVGRTQDSLEGFLLARSITYIIKIMKAS